MDNDKLMRLISECGVSIISVNGNLPDHIVMTPKNFENLLYSLQYSLQREYIKKLSGLMTDDDPDYWMHVNECWVTSNIGQPGFSIPLFTSRIKKS
jgi:hypothetical protein